VDTIPLSIGELKVGEKRTGEIRGRLEQVKEPLKGELTIGINLQKWQPEEKQS
jgi:hypothetical protein